MSSRDHESELPTVLQRRHTDEYAAPAYTDADRRVIARLESSSPEAADRVHAALEKTYKEKLHLTRDMGGTASTSEFADAVIENMESVAVATG